MGAANQAGEDNRNVARMALLLAGLPVGREGTLAEGLHRHRATRGGELVQLLDAACVDNTAHMVGRGPHDLGERLPSAWRDAEVRDAGGGRALRPSAGGQAAQGAKGGLPLRSAV